MTGATKVRPVESTTPQAPEKKPGSYIQDQFIAILFPIFALWYGPKYLMKGEWLKGAAIIVIFAVEMWFAFWLQSS